MSRDSRVGTAIVYILVLAICFEGGFQLKKSRLHQQADQMEADAERLSVQSKSTMFPIYKTVISDILSDYPSMATDTGWLLVLNQFCATCISNKFYGFLDTFQASLKAPQQKSTIVLYGDFTPKDLSFLKFQLGLVAEYSLVPRITPPTFWAFGVRFHNGVHEILAEETKWEPLAGSDSERR